MATDTPSSRGSRRAFGLSHRLRPRQPLAFPKIALLPERFAGWRPGSEHGSWYVSGPAVTFAACPPRHESHHASGTISSALSRVRIACVSELLPADLLLDFRLGPSPVVTTRRQLF